MVIIRNEIRTFEELTGEYMETLKQTSRQILEQLLGLAGKMTDKQFSMALPVLMDNSIGKHYRHIIEFYQVMLEGIGKGRINYDSRRHNLELEQSREKCLSELHRIRERFNEPFWQDPLELSGSYSLNSDELYSVSTNAEREIVYNIEHAVHHMAIIRIAVQHDIPELEIEPEFGYAFSTLKHLRQH
jgi:hypothetical protein